MAKTPQKPIKKKPASDRTPEKPIEKIADDSNVAPKQTKLSTPPERTRAKAPRTSIKRRIRPPLPVSQRIFRFLSMIVFMLMGGGLVYGICSVSSFLAEDLGRSFNLPSVYVMGFIGFLLGAMLSGIVWTLGIHDAVLTYIVGPVEAYEDSPTKRSSEKVGKRGGLRSPKKKNK